MYIDKVTDKKRSDIHRNSLLPTSHLDENTKSLRSENDSHRLYITEALIMQLKIPVINLQATGKFQALKLTRQRPRKQQQTTGSIPPLCKEIIQLLLS